MEFIVLGLACAALGYFWSSRPELIADRLRARGQLKETHSRELQVRASRWFGWSGMALGVVLIISGITQL